MRPAIFRKLTHSLCSFVSIVFFSALLLLLLFITFEKKIVRKKIEHPIVVDVSETSMQHFFRVRLCSFLFFFFDFVPHFWGCTLLHFSSHCPLLNDAFYSESFCSFHKNSSLFRNCNFNEEFIFGGIARRV